MLLTAGALAECGAAAAAATMTAAATSTAAAVTAVTATAATATAAATTAAAAAPQTFVVLKHSWRGTYERVLCIDGAWVRTLHP